MTLWWHELWKGHWLAWFLLAVLLSPVLIGIFGEFVLKQERKRWIARHKPSTAMPVVKRWRSDFLNSWDEDTESARLTVLPKSNGEKRSP